jgi:tetratricopeptide (TPR) repeat protein
MKKLSCLVLFAVVVGLMSGCTNSNIFSWSHSKGKSDSKEVLLVDAQASLNDGDYAEAIEYYNDILDKDPDNSEALYGLAAAEMKNSGLDIADLMLKFMEEGENEEMPLLSVDLLSIEAGTAAAIDSLEKIASGLGDGDIPADDFDVNLNLGIAKTLHAASSLINWAEASGVVDIKENYDVEIDSNRDTANDPVLKAKLQETKEEIESALANIEVAMASSGEGVSDIKDGFDDLISSLDTQIAGL